MQCKRKSLAPWQLHWAAFSAYGLLASGCIVHPPSSKPSTPWPIVLRSQLDRLAKVTWNLRKAAGDQCAKRSAASGITLDALAAYEPRDQADLVKIFAMTDAPQVAAVVPGSPADAAGIQPGDDILAIGNDTSHIIKVGGTLPELLSSKFEDTLAGAPAGRAIEVTIRRGGTEHRIRITPERLCDTRVILKTSRTIEAYSDGNAMAITTGMVEFMQNDDELALLVGHEFSHVIYRDEGAAKGLGDRRHREDRADLLGAALAHCGGYHRMRGLAFWERYRKGDVFGFLRDPTHRPVIDRIARISRDSSPNTCPLTSADVAHADIASRNN